MENRIAKEEYLMKLYSLQQEAEKYEEQLNLANQQITELDSLAQSILKIENEKDILAPMGRGIYVKTEVKDPNLFINIGSNIVVKRNPKQAVEIITSQIVKIEEMKIELMAEMENLNNQLRALLEQAQKIDAQ